MKIKYTLFITMLLTLTSNAEEINVLNTNAKEAVEVTSTIKPYYQGTIEEVLHSGGYTYLLIDENIPGNISEKLKSFWITVNRIDANIGDYVRFKKEFVTKNFQSKTLNKTFPEIMFASGLEYKIDNH